MAEEARFLESVKAMKLLKRKKNKSKNGLKKKP